MRILLTGGAGFIGSHLAEDLDRHDHEVYCLDLVAPTDPTPYAGWWQGDLLDTNPATQTSAELDEMLETIEPEVVVHLAAQIGRLFGEDDIGFSVRSNGLMSALVARSVAQYRLPARGIGSRQPRLVYTSTSEVYGDQGDATQREVGQVGRGLPHNLYGLSKRWGEEASAMYALYHHPDAPPYGSLQILRPSMPYGPGLPPGRGRAAIVNMLWQAHNRRPIIVHRGAERSWCWVGDAVRAIRLVIERGEVATTFRDFVSGVGAYNIGRDDAAVSMEYVARLACDLTGAPESLIELVDAPVRQTVVKRLATDRIRGLGWTPNVNLAPGMSHTLAYMREHGQLDPAIV